MNDYLLTRDILFNVGKAYIANLDGNTSSEAGFLMIATKDIDHLRGTSINAADDYIELLKVCKQRIDSIIGD